ncbi:hypothetical protein ACFL5W_00240 [Thermodesulfobacteriota bacterium]
MKDYLISQFIDDELDLEEKIEFVESLDTVPDFKDEALDLLNQESIIRMEVVTQVPSIAIQPRRFRLAALWRPVGMFATGMATAMILLALGLPSHQKAFEAHRFVLYQPKANQVEIAGTFSGWEKLPMKRIGSSGYWETILELPEGDHRFSYIVEGRERLPDPTVLAREHDDFGGLNSILEVRLET